ncbi:MAG: MerR family transcriptional regulator [Sediminimonas qiaohouensis]|uniref:MerR family transcriptional regulator n=1 Tax=Sediminimonas qiaohouensis TaxID=552061 RepID=A0A7C9HAI7_9RHOB|nr:MerR family transcriptional regulator [Sediminimonas qiaohouensis]MTJ04329.1 MerR family transcriptional regulator [Sediminimonas qiaohouensis]
MGKSPDAFRTISEVAEWLDRPAHVLRFWESKFSQIKPVKRAGGRRYYRPQDMLLLGGIKKLLHDEGMTIKGVQKVLRENGVKHVSDLSDPLDDTFADDAPAYKAHSEASAQGSIDVPEDAPQSARVLTFPREGQPQQPAANAEPEIQPAEPETQAAEADLEAPDTPAPQAPDATQDAPHPDPAPESEAPADTTPEPAPKPSAPVPTVPANDAPAASLCATIAALRGPIDADNSARVRALLEQLTALYAPTEDARKE